MSFVAATTAAIVLVDVVVHDDDDDFADGDIPPTAFRHNDPTRIA